MKLTIIVAIVLIISESNARSSGIFKDGLYDLREDNFDRRDMERRYDCYDMPRRGNFPEGSNLLRGKRFYNPLFDDPNPEEDVCYVKLGRNSIAKYKRCLIFDISDEEK